MILTIDTGDPAAPYEQIVAQVTDAIAAGTLATGARLPTVRQLAGDLGLAVNTVAKAYKQLEAEGHVATRGRNGTVVLEHVRDGAADETQAAATLLARTAQRHGLDLAEAIGVLRRAW
ncbi:GntR family transcriptional regulator [Arsenicicoccus sp. oral taxon 190]|uniref:GntR family transcriptional regulator n=1 Tax=Arsenicicoccus sp. oral taxon 190 TaxID=1658671 RepID=UPI00067A3966|nr:GntR family transcriptional regulator [Arsenicicoccus sp. oral taxon 190]AKT51383.1 GntR family transcriptional regulator [Arsenicicoccus sp. oral taxon 190]